jgi:hypothetical protein
MAFTRRDRIIQNSKELYKTPDPVPDRVLARIFGPKRDEVTGGWRNLHNEELHNLYSSPSIIRMMKSKRMRWAGHVTKNGGEEECI